MRKLHFAILLLVPFLIVSCNKDSKDEPHPNQPNFDKFVLSYPDDAINRPMSNRCFDADIIDTLTPPIIPFAPKQELTDTIL